MFSELVSCIGMVKTTLDKYVNMKLDWIKDETTWYV
jgi:hypothetical protein